MNTTITLDVAGTALTGTTFNIYQDVDLYASAVASNVSVAALQSGYAVTLNDNTNTVRVLSNGACGNFKDIPVDRGDTSPSIVNQYTNTSYSPVTQARNIAGNGKSEIFISISNTVLYSTDNGDTFTSENWKAVGTTLYTLTNSGAYNVYVLHDGTNLYLYWLSSTAVGGGDYERTLHVYRVTNYTSGFASATYTEVLSQTLGINISTYFMKYINNAYYLSVTEDSSGKLLRTTDLSVDFRIVSSPDSVITSIDNYGKTVFYTAYNSSLSYGGGVYKSIDNGYNWTQIYDNTNILHIDVESANRHTLLSSSTYKYTTDGGTTYSSSVPIGGANPNGVCCFIKKYKSVYLLENGTGTNRLYYIPNMYTAGPLGVVQVGTDMSGTSLTSLNLTAESLVLLQRNSLTLINAAGIYSFLIEDTI